LRRPSSISEVQYPFGSADIDFGYLNSRNRRSFASPLVPTTQIKSSVALLCDEHDAQRSELYLVFSTCCK
jgi:hypothetical protein